MTFHDIQNLKKVQFEGDLARLIPKIFFSENPGQNIWNKIEKSCKTGQVKKF